MAQMAGVGSLVGSWLAVSPEAITFGTPLAVAVVGSTNLANALWIGVIHNDRML
jgi:hypothetical protein